MCEVLMHVIVPDTVQGDIDGCKDALDAILNYYVQFLHGMMLPSSQLSVSIIDTKLAEPHLKILLHFIPCTVPIVSWKWRDRLLQEFQNSVCMKGTEMVVPLKYQQLWLQSLPKLLWELKHTHPPSSKAVLQMLLHLGRSARDGSVLSDQYSSLQPALIPFLCTILPSKHKEGTSVFGPFVKLSRDCQELAVDTWCYFKSFSSPFLKAVMQCCLCTEVNVDIVVRIIEVIHSAFSRGCIQLQHHLSFLFTLLVGSSSQVNGHQKVLSYGEVDALDTPTRESKRRHYVICRLICMCIAETGDGDVVLQLLGPCLCENLVKFRTQVMLTTTMRVVAALSAGKESNKRLLPQPLANLLSQSTIQELLASEKDALDIKDEGRQILFQCCITLVFRYQNFPQCLFEKLLLSMHSDSHVGNLKGSDLLCAASRLLLEIFKQAGIAHRLSASESIIKSILQTLQLKVDNGATEGSTCQRELKELFNQVYMASCALFGWKIPNSSEVV
ncbi:hypothetical protein O6H91_06G117100 [Diphasiastrum complanatum]|uniref:Uncharacterized protein n=1 Tax=Diphasiastrum complanatum TaxID=34168 RepID=A0ACC2DI75_DIPCM|nr:hypothetical protein O6H91_06G117100 [Diphasiastrum complanatum]